MNEVIDRVVQYAHRYKLVNVETGEILGTFDLEQITGTVAVEGTKLNAKLLNKMRTSIADVDLQQIFMMDDTYSFEGDAPTVQRAWADSDGNPINSSYHKKNADIDVNSKNVNMGSGKVSWYGGYAYITASTGQGIILALPSGTGLVHYNTTTNQVYKYELPFENGQLALKSDIDSKAKLYRHLIKGISTLGSDTVEFYFDFITKDATTRTTMQDIYNYLDTYYRTDYIPVCFYRNNNGSIIRDIGNLQCFSSTQFMINFNTSSGSQNIIISNTGTTFTHTIKEV